MCITMRLACNWDVDVTDAVERHRPAAVLLNFLGFDYQAGNDIAGILRAFWTDGEKPALRPCCIVAVGRNRESLMSLFTDGKILEAFDVRFFSDHEDGVRCLKERLEH